MTSTTVTSQLTVCQELRRHRLAVEGLLDLTRTAGHVEDSATVVELGAIIQARLDDITDIEVLHELLCPLAECVDSAW